MIFEKVNRNKLHQELANAKINILVVEAINNTAFGAKITFAEGTDMDLVLQVIDAHDPTPIPQPLSLEEQIAEKDAQILELKSKQILTEQLVEYNITQQQELLELLIDMGVI